MENERVLLGHCRLEAIEAVDDDSKGPLLFNAVTHALGKLAWCQLSRVDRTNPRPDDGQEVQSKIG